ncbi:hypothetical protein JAAARDRAFT_187342 [Jaapia argillacea MUCL 33604]|uniref:Uncharacterized protein n=1 Tax=Jaapia argillacea MUCL 33604 TaxID=933084 RepID=A0A067QKD1_9AGAM|nr:hypothetical protein JAAARDRAFT_187342 [Jaapia argillacea MUCL 33604]
MTEVKRVPSYSINDKYAEDPPAYHAPTTYTIGSKQTDHPVVNPEQLKLHLRLLRAFHDLRQTVEGIEHEQFLELVLKMERVERWAWFVHLAVERFQRWVESLPEKVAPLDVWIEDWMPPLDVLMVWHSYLLNPSWYAEDLIRLPILKGLGNIPYSPLALTSRIDDLSSFQPNSTRLESWLSQTETHFSPFEAVAQLTHKSVPCPLCNTPRMTPYITADGVGYAQRGFKDRCQEGCPWPDNVLNKERLGLSKLAQDLARLPPADNPVKSQPSHGEPSLAGTLHTSTNACDTAQAHKLAQTIFSTSTTLLRIDLPKKHSIELKREAIVRAFPSGSKKELGQEIRAGVVLLANRIMLAYSDDRPFSVDLVGAVVRQGSFVSKMQELGWTEPSYFDSAGDEVALQHCIARYHAFLDLMASSPSEFFVPTLDIDLAWHTHQLHAHQYAHDCMKYVGRYIDHDDKVGDRQLSSAFDITCRAWKSRFGVQYMHCGCPLPGDTIGAKLSRLSHLFRPPASYLQPPESVAAGTHPSDHNAVHLPLNAAKRRLVDAMEALKIKERKDRGRLVVQKGKDISQRTETHRRAFLVPVPTYFNSGPGLAAAGLDVVLVPEVVVVGVVTTIIVGPVAGEVVAVDAEEEVTLTMVPLVVEEATVVVLEEETEVAVVGGKMVEEEALEEIPEEETLGEAVAAVVAAGVAVEEVAAAAEVVVETNRGWHPYV